MIDTITLVFRLWEFPSESFLLNKGFEARYDRKRGDLVRYERWGLGTDKEIGISVFRGRYGAAMLSVSLSLPKFIHGHNSLLLLPDEVPEAMDLLEAALSNEIGEALDWRNATVSRIDYATDYTVKAENIPSNLDHISRISLPRLRVGRHSASTVYWHSAGKGSEQKKPRTICAYDKYAEARSRKSSIELLLAKDKLRIEFRLKNTTTIGQFAKTNHLADNTAKTLFARETHELAFSVINKYLVPSICEPHASEIHPFLQLAQKMTFSRLASPVLYEFVLRTFGEESLIRGSFKISLKTLRGLRIAHSKVAPIVARFLDDLKVCSK